METRLVCLCLNEKELKACFSELAKFDVTWCSGNKIDPTHDTFRYSEVMCSTRKNLYIFFNKENSTYSISWLTTANERRLGNTTFYRQECFIANISMFIRLINFYFKKEKHLRLMSKKDG